MPEPPAKITYDEHVLPLLKEKCVACHNPDKKRGGVVLNNYTKVMEGGGGGVLVKPGDPDNSPLFQVMAHKREPFMPPSSPQLPDESVKLLRQWIADGALENSGSKAIATGPKIDVSLPGVVRGKPDGPPPMPTKALNLEPVVRTTRADAVTALACSPWAPLAAVGGQKQILLYNTDTLGPCWACCRSRRARRNVLKFSGNGGLLLAGGGHAGKSGKVVLWSVKTGERILEVGDENDSVLAADVSPDQTQVALGSSSKVVRIYSTKDGKLLHEIRKHTDWITSLEYSPDGVLLATGDRVGGLFVWEAFTGREYFSLRGHTAAITEISWRPDGNVCASASEDGTVRLWEMENGKPDQVVGRPRRRRGVGAIRPRRPDGHGRPRSAGQGVGRRRQRPADVRRRAGRGPARRLHPRRRPRDRRRLDRAGHGLERARTARRSAN